MYAVSNPAIQRAALWSGLRDGARAGATPSRVEFRKEVRVLAAVRQVAEAKAEYTVDAKGESPQPATKR